MIACDLQGVSWTLCPWARVVPGPTPPSLASTPPAYRQTCGNRTGQLKIGVGRRWASAALAQLPTRDSRLTWSSDWGMIAVAQAVSSPKQSASFSVGGASFFLILGLFNGQRYRQGPERRQYRGPWQRQGPDIRSHAAEGSSRMRHWVLAKLVQRRPWSTPSIECWKEKTPPVACTDGACFRLLKNDAVTLAQPVDHEVFRFLRHVCRACHGCLRSSACQLWVYAKTGSADFSEIVAFLKIPNAV